MTDQPFNVTAVFKPCGSDVGCFDSGLVRDRLSACGVSDPDARLDRRTGVLLVTFTWVGDPGPVIARVGAELADDWTLEGEASYRTPPSARAPSGTSWRPRLALALTLALAACVLVGWIPYDFDDGPLGYLLGAVLLGGPLCLTVYVFAKQRVAAGSTP